MRGRNLKRQNLGEMVDFKVMGDDHGSLVALEQNANVPFEIRRVYYF